MSDDIRVLVIIPMLLAITLISIVILLRVTDYYEARELKVREFCIEKQSKPKFCEEYFK